MKKVNASLWIEINCQCPHCNTSVDVHEKTIESIGNDMRADNCNIEIQYSWCKKYFIVENVTF